MKKSMEVARYNDISTIGDLIKFYKERATKCRNMIESYRFLKRAGWNEIKKDYMSVIEQDEDTIDGESHVGQDVGYEPPNYTSSGSSSPLGYAKDKNSRL